MKTHIRNVTLAIVAGFFSNNVYAQWYLNIDPIPPANWYSLADFPLSTSYDELDDPSIDPGFKLYSGYKAHDLLTLEFEYKDQMEFGVGNVFSGRELWLTDEDNINMETKALFFSGSSTFVIDESKRIHLRGGLYNWDLKPNGDYSNSLQSGKKRGTDIFYSVGSYFNVTEKIGFSAEWERFEFENEDVDFISTELRFSF